MGNPIYPDKITVKSATRDTTGQYGAKLKISDVNNMPFSVNEKHQQLWPVFENNIGKTINLTWSIPVQGQNWKAFISGAEVATQQVTAEPKPEQPVQVKTTAPAPAVAQNVATYSRESSIECQVAFKGIVELIDAGKIPIDSKLGMRAQAWALLAFDAVLPKATIELIDTRIADAKEAAKPKAKAGA